MKESYYFSHDYNARQDPKLQEVMAHHGVAGIGIYWCIVEQLYEQGGTLSLKLTKGIAYALHVDSDVVESVIRDFGLFDIDGDSFYSNTVNARLQKREDISEKRRKAIEARWGKKDDTDTNVLQMNNTCNTKVIQNDTKKIKEKEKEKEIEINNTNPILVSSEISKNATDVAENKEKFQKRKSDFEHSLIPFLGTYTSEQIREFADYWTEPNKSHTKMRYELERTWDTARRLAYWDRNSKPARHGSGSTYKSSFEATREFFENQSKVI